MLSTVAKSWYNFTGSVELITETALPNLIFLVTVDKAAKTRADEDARSAYAMGAVRGNQAKIRSEIN